MSFSKSQSEAIQHMDGPMLVLAGPGSGKTTVITHRIKNLIEHGIAPEKILVITFTKAAATEMKQRFLYICGNSKNYMASKVSFGTFHAIFFTVLKYAYGYDASHIISEEMRFQYIRELIYHYNLDIHDENEFISDLLTDISTVKNSQIAIEHFYSSHCGEEIFREIYKRYQKRLVDNHMLDFDDMLVYTYELFSQRKDILSAWQDKFSYILVDEFQDINQLQYDIIKMMIEKTRNLFVVGDDDQSIYGFRGSKPEIMLRFKKDYEDAVETQLRENYRSTELIVNTSMKLIGHNKNRFKKEICATRKQQEGTVRFLTFENQRQQNQFVLREIDHLLTNGMKGKEIAVLFRTNRQPRVLMEMLLDYHIPFYSKDKIPNIYEHWIARDLFTYLSIAHGNRDRSEFLKIMNKPKRYLGRDSLKETTVAFDEWEKEYRNQPWIAERIQKLWHDLLIVKSMNPYGAINYIRKGIDYDSYLEDYADYRNVNKEDLFEILEDIQASAKGYDTIEEWKKHIENYSKELENIARRKEFHSDAILLGTVHSVKGLEFQSVFIMDANEGIFPYKKAVLEEDIEEERRLFYVAMTRAKNNLTVCSTKMIQNKQMLLSRFVEECH